MCFLREGKALSPVKAKDAPLRKSARIRGARSLNQQLSSFCGSDNSARVHIFYSVITVSWSLLNAFVKVALEKENLWINNTLASYAFTQLYAPC